MAPLEASSEGSPHPDPKTALPRPVETAAEISDAVGDADLVALAVISEGAERVSEEASKHAPVGYAAGKRSSRSSSRCKGFSIPDIRWSGSVVPSRP